LDTFESNVSKEDIVGKAMQDFEGRMEAEPRNYDDVTRTIMIDAFRKRSYNMNITVKDNDETFNCRLSLA
jgi:uncharacterized protein (DUF2461 family)